MKTFIRLEDFDGGDSIWIDFERVESITFPEPKSIDKVSTEVVMQSGTSHSTTARSGRELLKQMAMIRP